MFLFTGVVEFETPKMLREVSRNSGTQSAGSIVDDDCAAQRLLWEAPAAGAQLAARGDKNKVITVEKPKLVPVPPRLLPQTLQIYVP